MLFNIGLCVYNVSMFLYFRIEIVLFLISVIVTDKSNLLLRYLHNQWDKKVNL